MDFALSEEEGLIRESARRLAEDRLAPLADRLDRGEGRDEFLANLKLLAQNGFMGLNVAAVDVDDAKLDLARRLGATVTVNAKTSNDPAADIKAQTDGGAQGVLVTAVSPKAFEQALGMVRRGGTVSLVGLPPGGFPLPIFDVVLNGITVRGSIVGTRLDLAEALAFAEQAKVAATVASDRLDNINDIFARMHAGQIEGRIVLDMRA